MPIHNEHKASKLAVVSARTLGLGARLQGMYVELLVHILSFLSAYDLVSVQLVSCSAIYSSLANTVC